VIREALDSQAERGRPEPVAAEAGGTQASGTQAGGAGLGEDFPLISEAVGVLEAFGSSDQRFEHGLALMITGLRARHDPGRAGPGATGPGATGPGATRPGTTRPGTAGPGAGS
jgi:hypothetical protein